MNVRSAVSIALLGLAFAALSAQSVAADDHDGLSADLAQLTEWFEGRFDNYWQSRSETSEEVEEPHGRIHSIFAPVEWPELGEHIFYVQQYADGDPSKIYRQRIYQFTANEEENAVQLTIYAPPDVEAVLDAHLDPSKLEGIAVSDLKSYPGCEVYWERKDDHFIGFTKPEACQVVSSRSGKTLVISDDLRLDANSIWIQDRAVDTEGNHIYGHKGGVPHKLWRARPFRCWAAAPKDAEESEWDSWRPIELMDQGGEFAFQPEDGSEAKYSMELFQATYKGATEVPILELAIREEGEERSIAYTWASPDSERIGINLRFLQVGCTRVDSDES